MADPTVNAPAPRRRRGLRIVIWMLAVLVVLVVAVYFVATSSAFFKGVILPRVSKSLNADVTVSDASISPFKQVILRDLKVQAPNTEPLVTAPEVRARYHLMDIIRGNIRVDELQLTSPTISLVEKPDGSSNLDPLLQTKKEEEKKPGEAKEPSKPAQIDIKLIKVTDATIRSVKTSAEGASETVELSHVNLSVEDVKNGQSGKLLLASDIKMDTKGPVGGAHGSLQAKLNGNFVFALTADLKPASIVGNTRFDVSQATGALSELASLGSDFDCDVTPAEIKQVALRFQKGSNKLGEVRVSGPFQLEKTEGKLKVQILSIDKQVLNLAGASSGLDFGPTTLNSTNEIEISKAGTVIAASGQVNLSKFQVTLTNQTTPPLDLQAQYDVRIDSGAKTALLRTLHVTGTQRGNPLLRGELTSPMTLAWGNAANAVGDSTLNLSLSGLDLAEWKPFIGDTVSSGNVNMKGKLVSQQGGKQLTFEIESQVQNLTAGSGTNQIRGANVNVVARGKASDLKVFNLSEYSLQLAQQNQPMLDLSGSGTYDAATENADMQINLRATLARLVQALGQPDIAVSDGTAELKGHLSQKQGVQTVTGNFVLANFTGRVGSNDFRAFGATADLHLVQNKQDIQFPKIAGRISEGGKPGGSFSISGNYDTSNSVAQVNAKLTDFNQNGLRPFLEPMLTDKKLVSVAVNGSAAVQYNKKGDSSIKADLQMTNLVVNDPKKQFPATPLEAKMQMDTALSKDVVDIRQFQIGLTPTQRARNEVQLKGKVDMTLTNVYQGNLTLSAESLDVTSYYDLFAAETKPESAKPSTSQKPTPTTPPPASQPGKAPEQKPLPFRNFTAEVGIGRLFLREVAVSNIQTTVKLNGGHILLNPCKLNLNGAPVDASADIDTGLPETKFDLAFNLQAVPLAPLVNSFQPESKGQMGGNMTATGKLGANGTSGESLQKSLAGNFDIYTTNLNLAVENVKSPWLRAIVNTVALLPDLAKDPTAAAFSLAEKVTGVGRGGLSDEMKKSPIDVVTARGKAGSGRIDLEEAIIQSVLFRANAHGAVTLAPVLTNSTLNVPVEIALSSPVAKRLNLLPPDMPTNAPYAKLPNFYTMTGTLGKTENKYDKMALLAIAGQGVAPLIGGKAGDVLKGLGGLIQKPQTTGTNAPAASTNAPSTSTVTGTNQPSTNAAPASPVNTLLDQLLKPKKK